MEAIETMNSRDNWNAKSDSLAKKVFAALLAKKAKAAVKGRKEQYGK